MDDIDRKAAARIVVVSGIPAGDSGTGRLVAHLQERLNELTTRRAKLIARPERPARWQIELWMQNKAYLHAAKEMLRYGWLWSRFWFSLCLVFLARSRPLILLHPQNLGYHLALRLLESRAKPSLVYLLDSSFFCVASYNHVKGESESCIRCLESGFGQIEKYGCKPFPRLDWTALDFAPRLQSLVKSGRVQVAAQSQRQARLAQRQFGLPVLPRVAGLWTQDWDEVFAEQGWRSPKSMSKQDSYVWDVLFHGHCLDAKGASWVASVAEACPDLRFMLPFPKPTWFSAPDNCSFVPCSWETGLREEIAKSRFVIVPSLWSAPIEGSLVKSIACAEAVLVVDNPTSYCDELPEGLVLKLSALPSVGAAELKRACETGWRPEAEVKGRWLEAFANKKLEFVPGLLNAAIAAMERRN